MYIFRKKRDDMYVPFSNNLKIHISHHCRYGIVFCHPWNPQKMAHYGDLANYP